MSEERHIFHCKVLQVDTGELAQPPEGATLVVLRVFRQRRTWHDNPRVFTQDCEPTLTDERPILVPLSRTGREFLANQLLSIGIPPEEHEEIVNKYLQRYFFHNPGPGVPRHAPYIVNILDISVSSLGGADFHEIVDSVKKESIVFPDYWAIYKIKFVPASKSWMESLKRIRLDSSLGAELGSCVICMEDYAECVDQLVTTLPCKHQFHVDCIVKSLEISRLCPMCRHPMPTT
ncbi:hypothetical protein OROMI_017697 [Orobanche minor]